MKSCYSGDAQTGSKQGGTGYRAVYVCVRVVVVGWGVVYPNRESPYLLWMELGPGRRTAYP